MIIPIFLQSLTIILSPLYILRGKIGLPFLFLPFPYTFLEILIVISVVATFVVFLKNGADFSKLKTKIDVPILLFLISATVAVFYSLDPIGGLGILKAYFIEPILFFYALIYTVRNVKKTNFLLYSLFIAAFYLCFISLIQKITGQFSLAPYEIAQGRVSALYNSANSLSLFIGPISLLVLSFFFFSKKVSSKFLYLLFFVSILLIIFWTKSRGGLISEVISIGIFTYTLLSLRFKLLKKIWYGIPLLVTFFSIFFLYQIYLTYDFIPYTYGLPYTQGDTLQIRFFIWTGTVNMIHDHPILGAGLNGFKTLYSNQYRLPQYQEQFQYPHNLLLTFWTEMGILGLFSFLFLLVSIFSGIIRQLSKSKFPILGAALLSGLSYWIIHGFVDVPYFKNDLSFLFWVFVALTVIWSEIEFKKESK